MKEQVRHYAGAFDPLATYARLRAACVLGTHSYLHIGPEDAEIGWAAADRLSWSALPADWQGRLGRFAAHAKAFGYLGFDAADGRAGALPDGSPAERPLAEWILPTESVTFADGQATHRSRGDLDLGPHLAPRAHDWPAAAARATLDPVAATPGESFLSGVRRVSERIRAGEVHKVVLSRFEAFEVEYDPLALFAEYCLSRSFVDAFFLDFGDLAAIVASPELLLSARDERIVTNPLAGTRPRGGTPEEDSRLRAELKHNRKELAEHMYSVTSMLGELESLCEPGTLVVSRLMDVCLQPRVQHLSSVIQGRLAAGRHVLDPLAALFPSVTVSGVPKDAALRIVRHLERHPRGLYSGVIGWVSGAACRFSLAIRGIYRYGRRTFLQAGAGIMAESDPLAELDETAHKLAAMREALARAVGAARR